MKKKVKLIGMNKNKTIAITTYFFYPQITPRAFRAFELAKEISRKGYSVEVYCPDIGYDYTQIEQEHNITINTVAPGFFLNKNVLKSSKPTDLSEKRIKKMVFSFIFFIMKYIYVGGRSFEFAITLASKFRKEKKSFDSILSIGLPFCTHFGVALASLGNKKLARSYIADYGDPFSFNKELNTTFYYKYIEKLVLNRFDAIVVPTEIAVETYTYFKPQSNIKVIPQGFDFSSIRLHNYEPNEIVSFGYGGVFYEKIRNPKCLLDFLCKYEGDFRFYLFTDVNNSENIGLLNPYKEKLGDKLIISPLLPREDCLYELSKCDFLININNISQTQIPSKLIDYSVTKRPVYNFNQNTFSEIDFNRFLQRDYPEVGAIDISQYEIKTVADNFIKLMEG